MSPMDQNPEPGQADHPEAFISTVRRDLEGASAMDDATRLKTLEDLYRLMESELERDIDQAGPSRH